MASAFLSFRNAFRSLRTFGRDEVILQGAFLVGMTSLILLIAQYSNTTDTREEKYERTQRQTTIQAPPTPAYKDKP